jgi:hypothetical protein
MHKLSITKKLMICLLVVGSSFALFGNHHVYADGTNLPALANTANGQPGFYEEIAQSGNGLELNAPNAYYTVYSKTMNFNLNIYGCEPNTSSGDFVTNGCDAAAPNNSADYVLYYANASGIQSFANGKLREGDNNVLSGGLGVQLNHDQDALNYYAVKVLIKFQNSTPGQIFAFRLDAGQGTFVAYDGTDQGTNNNAPFAEQYRGSSCSDGYDAGTYNNPQPHSDTNPCNGLETNMQINFQTACDANSPNGVLQWYDADGYPSTSPQNWSIGFNLIGNGGGSNFTESGASMGGNLVAGGDGHDGDGGASNGNGAPIKTPPGASYTWNWKNVLYNNGIEFFIPANTIGTTGLDCSTPTPTTTVYGTVYDVGTNKGADAVDSGSLLSGVQIDEYNNSTCSGATPDNTAQTVNGIYGITVPQGNDYCLEVANNGMITTKSGTYPVYVRPHGNPGNGPNGTDYDDEKSITSQYCPAYGNYLNPNTGDSANYCQETRYHCQIGADSNNRIPDKQNCSDDYTMNNIYYRNRGTSDGYDFVIDTSQSNPPGNGNGDMVTISCSPSTGVAVASGTIHDPGQDGIHVVFESPSGTVLGQGREDGSSTYVFDNAKNNAINLGKTLDGVNPQNVTEFINKVKQDKTIAYPSCTTLVCSDLSVSGTVGESVTVHVSVKYQFYGSEGLPAQPTPNIKITGNGIRLDPVSPPNNPKVTYPNSTADTVEVDEDYSGVITDAGKYDLMYTATDSDDTSIYCSPASNGTANDTGYDQPYLKVFGGDTMAGSGFQSFASNCIGASSQPYQTGVNQAYDNQYSGTYGFDQLNSEDGNSYGSSTNEGLFAVALVQGFASSSGRRAGNGNGADNPGYTTNGGYSTIGPDSSLTFGGQNGGYGSAECVPDYYTDLIKSTHRVIYMPNAEHQTPILLPTTNPSQEVDLYNFKGNSAGAVYINNNIATPTVTSTALGSLPLYYLVVKGGDIYIDKGVTSLFGVFIAEPTNVDGQQIGGNIYTCTNQASLLTEGSSGGMFNPGGCVKQLTINGAFIANDVHFLRTNGSVGATSSGGGACMPLPPDVTPPPNRPATTTEQENETGYTSSDTVGSDCTNAAEVFNYTPLTWLANPLGTQTIAPNTIFSKAPVL